MQIFEKLKEKAIQTFQNISNKNPKVETTQNSEDVVDNKRVIYDLILEEMDKYQREYLVEVKKLKEQGHEHFIVKEVEDKIISLIDENEEVLTIIKNNRNLGMLAAQLGLENVVIRAIENEEVLHHKDDLSKTVGMYCAENKLEKAVMMILDDPISCLLCDTINHRNLGMYCAMFGLEKPLIKSLDNYGASIQQDVYGWNIGMHAVSSGCEEAVMKALDNHEASIQQDCDGWNIGMYVGNVGMENAAIKALDNLTASIQQDKDGWNIGMYCASSDLEQATLKAIKNPLARKQKDYTGTSLITMVQESDMKNLYDIAEELKNQDRMEQIKFQQDEVENDFEQGD